MSLDTREGENSGWKVLVSSDILWKTEILEEDFHFDFGGSLAALVRTVSLAQRGCFFLNLWPIRDSLF